MSIPEPTGGHDLPEQLKVSYYWRDRNGRIITHTFFFDWPWEVLRLRDWVFQKSAGEYNDVCWLQVRILGFCSAWALPFTQTEQEVV